MDKQFSEFLLNWVAQNAPVLIELLKALVPLLALAVAGYAVHAVIQSVMRGRGR